ncbi:MAG TPA: glycoside hydrolase family 15 protein, partial [Bdellovibrionota bacterium]|nr:glycoside hydrolase family 15 protein [Bdellovibrionota bacterium]
MPYLPLGDYGIIGNQASAALVSRLGSIDWCCFPSLDSPSHFGALLDECHGGRFVLQPQGEFRSEQRYHQRTFVLETLFETPTGRGILTDWMPAHGDLALRPILHRRVDTLDGRIQWMMSCEPRFGYGTSAAEVERSRGHTLFRGRQPEELGHLVCEVPVEIQPKRGAAIARFALEPGESARFLWAWGRLATLPEFQSPESTIERWRSWAHRCPPSGCPFAGPWHDQVVRSGLVLKLLTAPYSGALAEAVTTSLPLAAGGCRTWDLRYAWLREAPRAIRSFWHLGLHEECERYLGWIGDLLERDGAQGLQAVYTLDGGRSLPEHELNFLSGYRDSQPVRIGNEAARLFQLDIYGQIVLAFLEYQELTGKLPHQLLPRLAEVAEFVCQAWRRPDQGPWETRTRPEHFVASKLLCWAALDRACWLVENQGEEVPARWEREREILHHTICTQGFDPAQGAFVRTFSDCELDARALLVPLLGFLPGDDPRVKGTIEAIRTKLAVGPLVRRYLASDGIPGPEHVDLLSSLLFVSALARSGEVDEAADRLTEICALATPLGLFAEQIDPASSESVGNVPSA